MINLKKNDNQRIKTPVNVHNDQSQNNTHNKSWYKTRKQKDKESERKTIPEDKVLRSSNITDLVMEGLMFTIRQDEDSVAVIEQKTKLEVDEVLENSEKVETKAGEKCLLNSSLLRLENLVTMIDSSHEKNKHRKIDERLDKSSVPSYTALSANNKSCLTPHESQGRYLSNIKNGDSCSIIGNTTEKDNLMQWPSNNEQNRKDGCNSKMEKEDEVVSDISLQSPIFSLGEAILQNEDLPMNDIERTDKCDTTTEGSSSQSKMIDGETFAISEQSTYDKLSRQEANLPRIISDKVITVEQIPLPLQNIVRTYRKRKFSSTNSSDEFQRECKMRQPETLDNTISDTVLLDDESINDKHKHTANNSSFITLTDSEGMKTKKNQSCETIDKNIQETATRANVKEKNNDTQRTLRRNSPSKHGSPRLQDITEDFYYDLLHVHNKDDVQQRRLRQRRRSLNSSDNTKNKIQIEMLKFIQDITEGARVVVKRLNMRKETVNSIC